MEAELKYSNYILYLYCFTGFSVNTKENLCLHIIAGKCEWGSNDLKKGADTGDGGGDIDDVIRMLQYTNTLLLAAKKIGESK